MKKDKKVMPEIKTTLEIPLDLCKHCQKSKSNHTMTWNEVGTTIEHCQRVLHFDGQSLFVQYEPMNNLEILEYVAGLL